MTLHNIQQLLQPHLPTVTIDGESFAMDTKDLDSFDGGSKNSPIHSQILSEGSISFFSSQTFIGYQISALIAQNWLVNKACTQKVRDAVKSWYVPTINDGGDGVDADVISRIKKIDKRMGLKKHLIQAGRFNNIFGIRHVLFEYEDVDYEKPFNADGIKPGSYLGMTQIDPYWLSPHLSGKDVSDPTSQDFYNPEHWVVGGRGKIHRSHFVILRGPEVADYLKPSYQYAGIGLPQLIFERAYAAERTANEAPEVAMSKRLNVRKVDLEKVAADPAAFEEALGDLVNFRDNFGVHVIDIEEEHQQFDTNLTDFDSVIMTQYQIAAAISNTPATKLMGTAPKGFNATGEFEIESYHEELESIQEMDLSPIIERHNLCLMKSAILPEFGKEYEVDVVWNPVKVESRKEKAEINEINSRTDKNYIESGAISQEEVRLRLINDPDSGYSGLEQIDQDEIDSEFGLSDEDDEQEDQGSTDKNQEPKESQND